MTIRRKCITAAAVLAAVPVIFSLHGQNAKTEPKGLIVTSTVLDPTTRQLTVGLQNTSAKTIVAYTLHLLELDENGRTIFEVGSGYDFLDPDNTSGYILAGQPAGGLGLPRIDDRSVVSVKADVIAVVYLDGTYEGIGGIVFDGRINKAASIRKDLAEEKHTPAEKTRLEKRAAFFEAAAIPVEGK
jgi:hypothetical protein